MNALHDARSEVLHLAWRLGLYSPPDRRVLEQEILADLASASDIQTVLFVGVKWYNARNNELFGRKTYATIDPDPSAARFGAALHAVDVVQNLEAHFPGIVFDAIVMTGVIGWGINDAAELDRALVACSQALRPAGWLILGVNELTPNHVDPTSAPTSSHFAPTPFGQHGRTRLDIPLPFKQKLHTFLFWQRCEPRPQADATYGAAEGWPSTRLKSHQPPI